MVTEQMKADIDELRRINDRAYIDAEWDDDEEEDEEDEYSYEDYMFDCCKEAYYEEKYGD